MPMFGGLPSLRSDVFCGHHFPAVTRRIKAFQALLQRQWSISKRSNDYVTISDLYANLLIKVQMRLT